MWLEIEGQTTATPAGTRNRNTPAGRGCNCIVRLGRQLCLVIAATRAEAPQRHSISVVVVYHHELVFVRWFACGETLERCMCNGTSRLPRRSATQCQRQSTTTPRAIYFLLNEKKGEGEKSKREITHAKENSIGSASSSPVSCSALLVLQTAHYFGSGTRYYLCVMHGLLQTHQGPNGARAHTGYA